MHNKQKKYIYVRLVYQLIFIYLPNKSQSNYSLSFGINRSKFNNFSSPLSLINESKLNYLLSFGINRNKFNDFGLQLD